MVNWQTLHPHRRRRRQAIEKAQAVIDRAEGWLVAGLLLLLALPFLTTGRLDLSTWLWWVKGFAMSGLLAWGLLRLAAAVLLAPSQLTGAAVEAMEQTGPDEDVIIWSRNPVEGLVCCFLARQIQMADDPLKTRPVHYWQRRQRRPQRRRTTLLLCRPLFPRAASAVEASV